MDQEFPKQKKSKKQGELTRPRQSFDLFELEQITDENIDFSAIDEGIGFHPKKNALFASGKTKQEQIQSNKKERINQLKTVRSAHSEALAKRTAKKATKKTRLNTNPLKPKENNELPKLATRGARSIAALIDLVLVNLPILGVFFTAWGGLQIPSIEFAYPLFIMHVFINFNYFVFIEALGGQSIGKFFLKIQVLENDRYCKPIGLRSAFTRTFFWMLFFLPICLSLFFTFWRSNYTAWHDRVSCSVVARAEQ